LEHGGRSEAGWSSLHDEEVYARRGVKSRRGFYSLLFSFIVYLSLFLPSLFFSGHQRVKLISISAEPAVPMKFTTNRSNATTVALQSHLRCLI
jgi:hypothetical protein